MDQVEVAGDHRLQGRVRTAQPAGETAGQHQVVRVRYRGPEEGDSSAVIAGERQHGAEGIDHGSAGSGGRCAGSTWTRRTASAGSSTIWRVGVSLPRRAAGA